MRARRRHEAGFGEVHGMFGALGAVFPSVIVLYALVARYDGNPASKKAVVALVVGAFAMLGGAFLGIDRRDAMEAGVAMVGAWILGGIAYAIAAGGLAATADTSMLAMCGAAAIASWTMYVVHAIRAARIRKAMR